MRNKLFKIIPLLIVFVILFSFVSVFAVDVDGVEVSEVPRLAFTFDGGGFGDVDGGVDSTRILNNAGVVLQQAGNGVVWTAMPVSGIGFIGSVGVKFQPSYGTGSTRPTQFRFNLNKLGAKYVYGFRVVVQVLEPTFATVTIPATASFGSYSSSAVIRRVPVPVTIRGTQYQLTEYYYDSGVLSSKIADNSIFSFVFSAPSAIQSPHYLKSVKLYYYQPSNVDDYLGGIYYPENGNFRDPFLEAEMFADSMNDNISYHFNLFTADFATGFLSFANGISFCSALISRITGLSFFPFIISLFMVVFVVVALLGISPGIGGGISHYLHRRKKK